ncbi:MAG: class I SAM-dependent methyltransferase [Planctomycetota bacterium]|jgi:23S rRNA (cytosine1962-C5)-methyltransferase|nr:class I SAM-dependent methyltransferase [Planctomycetota bacterium]
MGEGSDLINSNDPTYRFLDCGNGKRLERFGPVTLVRPAPAALHPAALGPEAWEKAGLVFTPGSGWQGSAPPDWRVGFPPVVLGLTPGSQGQIGVFPEHLAVVDWLEKRLPPPALPVLNLFAHTGLATLRLAASWLARGTSEIVHLDASRRAVRTARENAAASGLAASKIRWLVDDALLFLAREKRRGRQYGLILADPPRFGRERRGGGEWRLERDLDQLLGLAGELLAPEGGAFCLSCHSQGWREEEVVRRMAGTAGFPAGRECQELRLESGVGGNSLACGFAVLASSRLSPGEVTPVNPSRRRRPRKTQ